MSYVDQLMISEGPSIDFDPDFREVLEDHMTYLRNHPQTQQLLVTPDKAYQFEFDLHGYLTSEHGEPLAMHWIIMRASGLRSTDDFGPNVTVLYKPSSDVISQIRQTHVSTHSVS